MLNSNIMKLVSVLLKPSKTLSKYIPVIFILI